MPCGPKHLAKALRTKPKPQKSSPGTGGTSTGSIGGASA